MRIQLRRTWRAARDERVLWIRGYPFARLAPASCARLSIHPAKILLIPTARISSTVCGSVAPQRRGLPWIHALDLARAFPSTGTRASLDSSYQKTKHSVIVLEVRLRQLPKRSCPRPVTEREVRRWTDGVSSCEQFPKRLDAMQSRSCRHYELLASSVAS